MNRRLAMRTAKQELWPEWACTTTVEMMRPERTDPALQWAYKLLGVSVILAVSLVASAMLH
jgi:hypothetical protein